MRTEMQADKGRTMPVARSKFVPELPEGKLFGLLERRGEFVMLFVEGECSPQLASEMTETFQQQLDRKAWTQNWQDREDPPQALAS